MDMQRRKFAKLSGAIAATAMLPQAFAQSTYPNKTIRLIIPFAPGGGTDIVGRVIANKLGEALGQTVVVENKGGGNGTIGADAVAKSAPDGYTLSMVTASHSVNVTLQGNKHPYDFLRDLAPITQITSQPYVLVVNPDLPVKNLMDLIALAKAKPNSLNFGSSGPGGLSHLSGELFAALAKIKMTHVPYKGGAPALADVVAGQIQMLFSTRLQAQAFISAGRLRQLAVTTSTRSAAAPEVLTMAEAGVPGYEVSGWYGIVAPGATPKPIIDRLNREILTILKMADVREKMATDGSEPVGTTPAQFGAHLKNEVEKWRKVIQEAHITA